MGLKDFGKSLISGAKKAAPLLNFVPGGNYINAGINALDTKVNQGGSWGDAAKAGVGTAMGGGGGLGPQKIPGMPGPGGGIGGGNLGNRNGLPGGVMNFGGQNAMPGFMGTLGNFMGGRGQGQGGYNENVNVRAPYGEGPQMRMPGIQQTMTSEIPGIGPSKGFDWKSMIGPAAAGLAGYGIGRMQGGGGGGEGMYGPQTKPFTPSSGGYGRSSGYDQSAPNLSYALHQGANEAIASQPWRQSMGISPSQPLVMGEGGGGTMPRRARARG